MKEGFTSKHLPLKRILVVTRGSQDEIKNPTFGGSRLIKELIRELTMRRIKVYILSIHDLRSLSAFLLRIKDKDALRLKVSSFRVDKLKWFLNLFSSLIAEMLSRIDVGLRREIKIAIDKIKPDAMLYNGSIGAFTFLNEARRRNIPFILCEHNVNYYFYEDKLRRNPLVNIFKVIELLACKAADLVICFNPCDKERLVRDDIRSDKIIVWRFDPRTVERYDEKRVFSDIPTDIQSRLRGKFVVGFLGANYTLNVIVVKYILKIAEKLPKDIVFLIIGSVGEAFERIETSSNVIFTGYVEDVRPYLAITHVLLNLKFTSNTGIEAKMFDYVSCGKLIISTKIAATGFEYFPKVIIVENLRDVVRKIIELYKEWKAKK